MKGRHVGLLVALVILSTTSAALFSSNRPVSARASQLERVIDRFHQAGTFDGVALVVEDGNILVKRAYGLADREQQIAHTINTKFRIASLTKLFTATLIMQLHEQKKLKFTDTISDILPEYPAAVGETVTIHHLLTNTSGLPNFEERTAQPIDAYTTQLTLDAFIATYCHDPLDFVPGTRFRYNNADYILLTKIIETVTGTPWEIALQQQILTPLGMDDTGVIGNDTPLTDLAIGYYTEQGDRFVRDPLYYAQNYFGAGAMYSTIDDLLRFERGLQEHTLLSESSKQMMRTAQPQFGNVAYGTWVYTAPVADTMVRISERSGSTWGSSSTFVELLDDNSAIILLSNTNNIRQSYANALKNELLQALYQQIDQSDT